MTTPVSNTSSGSTNQSANDNTVSKLADSNFNDFLKLLTTQLKNQDPTAPTDTNQLTQQIATLSQVEQQISTNNNLQKLVSLYSQSQNGNLVSYIGKNVDAVGNSGWLQNGQALFAYNLPQKADSVTITVSDSAGKKVYTGAGPTTSGRNPLIWDGTDTNGNKMADGIYKIDVKALDANGKAIDVTTYTTGIVTSVNTADGTSTLAIGNLSVSIDDVLSVRNLQIVTDNGSSDDSSADA